MKFFIALVLALAVCGFASAQQVGGYTPIPWNSNDQELVDFLNYGLQQAVPQAIAAGQLSEGEWNWTNVLSVQRQVTTETNYDYIVDIEDESGDTARMNLIVSTSFDGSSISLSNWAVLKM